MSGTDFSASIVLKQKAIHGRTAILSAGAIPRDLLPIPMRSVLMSFGRAPLQHSGMKDSS
jgi:hypothetical protein